MKSIYRVFFVLAAVVLTVSGGMAMAGKSKDGPIVIGILENRNYAFATMMKRSFGLAEQKINERGGIYGRPIQLVFANDGGDKSMGIRAVSLKVFMTMVVSVERTPSSGAIRSLTRRPSALVSVSRTLSR